MALTPGTRLGPYEVLSSLGAGGMGEVYQAKDTRLERVVAIKVLSSALSASAELKLRFEREAKTISSLNHPNICSLFDVGNENGTDFLVMEFIEGDTLAEVLKKGPLPVDRAIRIALEVVDALEKAHRSGIIHRDLKPGNIMLTKAGAKLMDFGLAKPVSAATGAADRSGTSPLFSAAATRSSPASPLTSVGSIVGTVQYMSPEQIEGRDSDARSDIFAFGLVLYEMIGGRRPFEGKTQASVVASILALDPAPLSAVQPATPSAVNSLVNTCLAKDPEDRYQTAHDLKLHLRMLTEVSSASPTMPTSFAKGVPRAWWAAVAVLALLAAGASFWAWRLAATPEKLVRGNLLPIEGATFGTSNLPQVSPNGKYVVYSASKDGIGQLWLQAFDLESPQPMAGTEGANYPFWSPDSRSVGFFSGNRLKRVEVAGGPAQTLCDVLDGRGGSWNSEGTIIFGSRITSIQKVSSAGGTPVPVTELDKTRGQGTHRWPWFLPDGKSFLFMAGVTGNDNPKNEIYIGTLDSKNVRLLMPASSNVVYASGYLLFRRESSLMAQPFDAKRHALDGDAVPIAEQLRFDPGVSAGSFSASSNGILVVQHGSGNAGAQQLTWFDSTGKQTGVAAEPSTSYSFRISPDGKWAATQTVDSSGNVDIWVHDLARKIKSRLTFDSARELDPVWFPDSKRVAYASEREDGRAQLFAKNADGSGNEERLLSSKAQDSADDISSDGKYLAYTTRDVAIGPFYHIWLLPLAGERKPFAYTQSGFSERDAKISPDMRWLAYASDESGKFEVYVSTFPKLGSKWQISNNGGIQPMWSTSGKELYYLTNDNDLMVVSVSAGANSIQASVPKKLFTIFPTPGRKVYQVDKTGHILVNSFAGDKRPAMPISFTVNWPAIVRR